MAAQDVYFSGQGIVYVADRQADGTILQYRDVGNVPALRVSLETDVVEHKESRTGQRLTDYRLTRENRARVTMTLEKFTRKNLQMLLFGTNQTTGSTTVVTGEVLLADKTNIALGDIFFTKFPNVSALTLKVGGGPTTLVLDTDYTLDAATGRITIISLTAITAATAGNLQVDYTGAAYEIVPMFKAANVERALRFNGLNTANSNASVIVELYRVIFDPVGNFDLINDELAQFEIEGSVLYDQTRDEDAVLGGFGRIIQ